MMVVIVCALMSLCNASRIACNDDELYQLCIQFNTENFPHIKTLLERPGYNINAELNSQWCGGMTLTHATFMTFRNIENPQERERKYPILIDTLEIFFKHKADPHVIISKPNGCVFQDYVTGVQCYNTIDSLYKHVLLANDSKAQELIQKYCPDKHRYSEIKDVTLRWDPELKNWYIYKFDAEKRPTDHHQLLLIQDQTELLGKWKEGQSTDSNSSSATTSHTYTVNTFSEKDTDEHTPPNIHFDSDEIIELCPEGRDNELVVLCTQYEKSYTQRITELIKQRFSINDPVRSFFLGGVTILHATYWQFTWVTKDVEKKRTILLDRMRLLLDHGADPCIMYDGCLINDEQLPAVYLNNTVNSTWKHARVRYDSQVIALLRQYHPQEPRYPSIGSIREDYSNGRLFKTAPSQKQVADATSQLPSLEVVKKADRATEARAEGLREKLACLISYLHEIKEEYAQLYCKQQ